MGRGDSYKAVDSVGVYFGDTKKEKDPYFNGLGPLCEKAVPNVRAVWWAVEKMRKTPWTKIISGLRKNLVQK
jgi:hypothetical protein